MHLVVLTAVLALAGPTPSIASPLLAGPAAAPAPVLPAPVLAVSVVRGPVARVTAGFVRAVEPERVVVRTQDKLSLVGSYWTPRGKQAAPGALLIHGAGGKRAEMDELAERLHKVGFAVLSIDLRGHGENATEGDEWSGLEREDRERLWAFATRDVVAGTKFLTDQKEVHSSSLVLVGHGAGAALVARHAVKDEDVRAIALLDPPSDKAATYGFQLDKDLEDLGGLPTYISVPKEGHAAAQRMADDGQRANGGLEFIRISVFRGASAELLSDTREAAEVSKWLKDRAFPSKSRGPR